MSKCWRNKANDLGACRRFAARIESSSLTYTRSEIFMKIDTAGSTVDNGHRSISRNQSRVELSRVAKWPWLRENIAGSLSPGACAINLGGLVEALTNGITLRLPVIRFCDRARTGLITARQVCSSERLEFFVRLRQGARLFMHRTRETKFVRIRSADGESASLEYFDEYDETPSRIGGATAFSPDVEVE